MQLLSIINAEGRKSRYRTADDIERVIRAGYAQGVRHYFITDDDFARNKNWEAILDRIIELKKKECSKQASPTNRARIQHGQRVSSAA
jgi:radical SAM superfamily enzyme YgiQ (UPF0313 family)